MKICNKCKIKKPKSEFYKDKSKLDGLQYRCKNCHKLACRKSRDTHGYSDTSKRVQLYRDWINELKIRCGGCCLCDEKEPCCLDFHHLKSETKNKDIAKLTSSCSPKIVDELKKCVLVCANCHRKIHNDLLSVSTNRLITDKYIKPLPIIKRKSKTYLQLNKNNKCIDCRKKIWKTSTRCVKCSNKKRLVV